MLRTEHRLGQLQDHERCTREYKKSNTNYWDSDIRDSRQKRQRISTEVRENSLPQPAKETEDDLGGMTVAQLKKKLKKLGTKEYSGKKRNELVDMLRAAKLNKS